MKWYEKIKSSENPKVISMLSGGKDSIVATILLKKEGIDVTAIHFIHNGRINGYGAHSDFSRCPE